MRLLPLRALVYYWLLTTRHPLRTQRHWFVWEITICARDTVGLCASWWLMWLGAFDRRFLEDSCQKHRRKSMTLKAKRPQITALRKVFISDKKSHFDTISIASSDRVTKRKSFAQRHRNINFPPTEVREGNVFSHVFNFLQEKSFLVLITGTHCRGSQSPLCRGPPLYGVLPPLSNLFRLVHYAGLIVRKLAVGIWRKCHLVSSTCCLLLFYL